MGTAEVGHPTLSVLLTRWSSLESPQFPEMMLTSGAQVLIALGFTNLSLSLTYVSLKLLNEEVLVDLMIFQDLFLSSFSFSQTF